MKLAICVMHAAFDPKRVETLGKLRHALTTPGLEAAYTTIWVEADHERSGAWAVAKRCWQRGIDGDTDWIIVLNDDAMPCEDFVARAKKALAQRDHRDPVCFFTAHSKAGEVEWGWYTTFDDLVGIGCALSREAAKEFLTWAEENASGLEDFSDDGRINLWAIATGRRVHTTVPSLVDHQLPAESMVGSKTDNSDGQRMASVPPQSRQQYAISTTLRRNQESWPVTPMGRARSGNHWEMLFRVKEVDVELIERAYNVERNGEPVSSKPHVFIAMPAYVTPEMAVRVSVQRVIADLEKHGIAATLFESPGDSLVTRGRHALSHQFLCTTATHFLQWDADIECLDPSAVRMMIATGRPVVGGAYPWRDGSGRVVANPLHDNMVEGQIDIDAGAKCFRVAEVGTGFMLVTRACLVDLMVKHPETMYMADIEPYVGCPMWALFDAHLEYRPQTGRRRYASEDWRFCQLAREAGHDVVVYYPPVFRHWGKFPHQGHIVNAWKMNQKPDAEAAE
jgi:hypothetical protein